MIKYISDMENSNNDNLSPGWTMLSNAAPPVGFYLYLRHKRKSPRKARKALRSALTGVPVAIALGYIMNTYFLK